MDLLLRFDGERLTADLALDGTTLATDAGLYSAVVASLFSDRRASPDDRLDPGETDRRGWWADALLQEGDRWGSRLWLVRREKHLPEVLARIEEYAHEALAWLREDGIATRVDIAATAPRTGQWLLTVDIHRPDGERVAYRFDHLWQAA